jgi:sodium transport system permease protein
MRWSIIRLIWMRDLRDQLRDRRTLFMMIGLPLLLYPVLGSAVLGLAFRFGDRPSTIGAVRPSGLPDEFPPRDPPFAGRSVAPFVAWLTATPATGAVPAQIASPCAIAHASRLHLDYPPLIESKGFTAVESPFPPRQAKAAAAEARLAVVYLDADDADAALADRKVDLVLSAPRDFYTRLEEGEDPHQPIHAKLTIRGRPNDETSRLAWQRLDRQLDNWKQDIKRVRLARRGMPDRYVDPVEIAEPTASGTGSPPGVFDLMGRLFPFMLVLWSLAGALYPAVDLCAGEKERGTMETLLITPAGREEIVLGKFLTIWLFSAGTALVNLLSMGITTWFFASRLPHGGLPIAALFWCVILSLPQAAMFSAVTLAIGAYARSSKEGQYYLMPLFLATMPLIFLTLAPGVELNAFYSLVPVTGVALLMQQLTMATSVEQVPWGYFVPVLGPIAIYSWMALRWAIEQFQREEVLFREAERWDWGLWLRRLFRDKEPLPTTGQALFCFGLIVALRWLSLGLGAGSLPEVQAMIVSIAFVAAPPVFMAMLLNTLPGFALFLRWPDWRALGLAAVLALVLLPPLAALAQAAYGWLLYGLLPEHTHDLHPLVQLLRAVYGPEAAKSIHPVLGIFALALVPAVCEELAFRGFILTGLHRRFRPRNAILVSAFLFALYHLNVFLFLPTFGLGVVLGLLTVRSRSLAPAVLLHFLHNALLLASVCWPLDLPPLAPQLSGPLLVGACVATALVLIWWLYRKPYAAMAQARRK